MDSGTRLTPLRLKRGILSESEVDLLTKEASRYFATMGPPWEQLMDARSESLRDHFRFAAVAQRCRDARLERGLSEKEVASSLKLPQYRIKAIEAGHFQAFKFAHLQLYVDYAGSSAWFRRWCKAHSALAQRLSAAQ